MPPSRIWDINCIYICISWAGRVLFNIHTMDAMQHEYNHPPPPYWDWFTITLSYIEISSQHVSPYVSGFRKGYDCQSVLLRFSESVKRHLDNSEVAGALLTYLSKAFNCLPHDLLVCNMYAYGLSEASCKLIASYLKDRYHRVNIGTERWLETSEKGHSTRINNGSLCV